MGDSTTHPILSMLLTHTTSGRPVVVLVQRQQRNVQKKRDQGPNQKKIRTEAIFMVEFPA